MRPKKQNWTNKFLNQEFHFKLKINNEKKLDVKNKTILEIGHGKGFFILKSAFLKKNYNFLGIEKNAIIFAYALRNIYLFEQENNFKFQNLKILNIDAKQLKKYFNKACFEEIILNYPDPWPKKRHQKRRLTSLEFIKVYEKILKNKHFLILKTDQENLWSFSATCFEKRNWKIIKKEKLLNNLSVDSNNIISNYQQKLKPKYYFYLKVQLNLKNENL